MDSRSIRSPASRPLEFPQEYSIRVSRRARRISLRVLPGKGLEVVLPHRADPACVPALLASHRDWIEKKLKGSREFFADNSRELPQVAMLKGGTEEVRIRVECSSDCAQSDTPLPKSVSGGISRLVSPPRLRPPLQLRATSQEEALRGLREWLREEARKWLGGMLAELATQYGFSFASLSIRFQRSRWGSCSARGGISLNACLLFLPEPLVRHILLHELCHTRQLNHSPRFWKELFNVDPDALAHDKALRRAWKHVPLWALPAKP